MAERGADRTPSPAAILPLPAFLLLLFVTFPRWPYYEDARLALLGALAPLPLLSWAWIRFRGKGGSLPASTWTGLAFWSAGILLSFSGPGPWSGKLVGAAAYLGLFSFFLGGSALAGERGGRLLLLAWVPAGAVLAAVGLLQALGLDPLGVTPPFEAGSLLGNRNAASEVCVVLAPGLAGLYLALRRERRRGILGWTVLGAFLLLLFYAGITRTRAGAAALAAGLGAALFLPALGRGGAFPRESILLLLGAALLWLGGRMVSPAPPAEGPGRTRGKVSAPQEESLLPSTWKVRLLLWRSTGKMALARPFTGWGAGSFEREFPAWRDPEEIRISGMDHAFETQVSRAHSDLLQVFAETGVLGLAGWLLLFFGSLAAGWRRARKDPAAAGLAGAGIGFFANGFFRSPLYNAPAAAAAFAALGALAALGRREEGEGKEEAPGGTAPAGRGLFRGAPFLLVLLSLYPAWRSLRAFQAHCLLSRALGETGREAYLRDLEAALRADPESPTALRLLARDLLERGGPRERARVPGLLERALQVRPYDVVTLRSRAEILFDTASALKKGNPQKTVPILAAARRDLEKALALDPENPSTLALLGRVLEALEDVPGAIEAWKKVSREHPDALRERARILEKEGREEMSCLFLQAWLEDHPGQAEYWRSLARRWRKLGRHTSADYCQGRAHRVWALEALKSGNLRLAALQTRLYSARAEEGDPGPILLQAVLALLQGKKEKAAALARSLPAKDRPLDPADLKGLEPWIPLLRKLEPWAALLPR